MTITCPSCGTELTEQEWSYHGHNPAHRTAYEDYDQVRDDAIYRRRVNRRFKRTVAVVAFLVLALASAFYVSAAGFHAYKGSGSTSELLMAWNDAKAIVSCWDNPSGLLSYMDRLPVIGDTTAHGC